MYLGALAVSNKDIACGINSNRNRLFELKRTVAAYCCNILKVRAENLHSFVSLVNNKNPALAVNCNAPRGIKFIIASASPAPDCCNVFLLAVKDLNPVVASVCNIKFPG